MHPTSYMTPKFVNSMKKKSELTNCDTIKKPCFALGLLHGPNCICLVHWWSSKIQNPLNISISGRHYGAISFFNSILHNVFLLYHVETFVSIYKIDKASFWIGETIFLLWNSLNDPLFGWFSDRKYLKNGGVSTYFYIPIIKSWNNPVIDGFSLII